MKTPLLIALALTALMIAVHIGLFWWFVLRESRKTPPPGPDDEADKP